VRSPTLPRPFAGIRWLNSSAYHTLRVGLAVSLCLHTGLLMLGLDPHTKAPASPSTLEVVLVNAQTDSAPVQASLLAQAQVDGGGDGKTGYATSPLPHTGAGDVTQAQEALRQRQMALEAEQHALLARLRSAYVAPKIREGTLSWDHHAAVGQDDRDQDSVLQHAHIAALTERVQAYNSQPRKHFFAPSTSPSRYAQYVDAWRGIIEDTGTRHYPPEARGRIYGWLRMTVTVRADGSVKHIEIDQPSPHALLNQAARRIVQLAAPFAPFPPDIARETDELSITRTWHFVNDTLSTRMP